MELWLAEDLGVSVDMSLTHHAIVIIRNDRLHRHQRHHYCRLRGRLDRRRHHFIRLCHNFVP